MRRLILPILLTLAVPGLASPPDAARLYSVNCARCHGDQGAGDGLAHTMQRPWPRDFTQGQYKFRTTPLNTLPTLDDVTRVVRKGILKSSMPAFEKFLSSEEISAVSAYVLDISRQASGLPQGRPLHSQTFLNSAATPVRLARGKTLYAKECMSCHGSDGLGFGPEAGLNYDDHGFWIATSDLTDPLSYGGGSRTSDIFFRLKTGIPLGPMPRFGEYLTDLEMADIALYVKSLQVAPDKRAYIDRSAATRNWPAKTRGEYLTRAMSCSLCHNSYDGKGHYYANLYLAGGVAITIPGLGVYPTRNLTSHPTDGLGAWSQDEIVRVLKTGRAPDRQVEAFAMPWPFFSHLSDGDARDIAAYLKSLPPIQNRVPARQRFTLWQRLASRVRQAVDLEPGRLEYPPFNVGKRDQ